MQWPHRIGRIAAVAAWGLTVAMIWSVARPSAGDLTIFAVYDAGQSEPPSFDPDGEQLSAIMAAAVGLWEGMVRDSWVLQLEYSWENLDGPTLALETTLGKSQGKPNSARIRVDAEINGHDRPWYIDPTPRDNSEFDLRQTRFGSLSSADQDDWYNGEPPDWLEVSYAGDALPSAPQVARDRIDLFSVVAHEIGHALGLAPLIAGVQTIDGDYDIPPPLVGGAVMAVATFNATNTAHLAARGTLMFPSFARGARRLPSATDVLALVSAAGWSDATWPTVPGDMDGDGDVDAEDSVAFALGISDPADYEASFGLAAVRRGDMDGDGDLDFDDIPPFVTAIGSASASHWLAAVAAVSVPEPCSAALLGVGAVLLILCRRPSPAAG